jgi:hypothetical protein
VGCCDDPAGAGRLLPPLLSGDTAFPPAGRGASRPVVGLAAALLGVGLAARLVPVPDDGDGDAGRLDAGEGLLLGRGALLLALGVDGRGAAAGFAAGLGAGRGLEGLTISLSFLLLSPSITF